jgi:hypothetical protein
MSRRGVLLWLWVSAGHASAAALAGALIYVPDANATLLALSALLVVSVVLTIAVTDATAILLASRHSAFRTAWPAAVRRGLPALAPAALAYLAVWLAATRLGDWHTAHAGEIDAWLMATFGSPRTTWVHTAIDVLVFVLSSVIGVSAGLAVLSAGTRGGLPAVFSPRWIATALSRRQLGAVGLVMVLFVVLPLRLLEWRPDVVSARWEPAFVGIKLSALYLIVHAGWTLLLWVAATPDRPPLEETAAARHWVA